MATFCTIYFSLSELRLRCNKLVCFCLHLKKCLAWVGSGLTHKSWIILMLGTFLCERLEFYSEEWQHFLWSELKLRCIKRVCFCQHFLHFFEMLHSCRLRPYSQILDYFDAWTFLGKRIACFIVQNGNILYYLLFNVRI